MSLGVAADKTFIPHTFPLNWPWITEEDRRRDHPITLEAFQSLTQIIATKEEPRQTSM
jgi:hypothetical protein